MTAIDFSKIVTGAGISLEQAAYSKFGAAVDQFSRGIFSDDIRPLGSISDVIRASDREDQAGVWKPANYANDLITYAPKHRFMFRVLFEMDPEYTEMIGGRKEVFQYVIKNIDRPKLNFDYESVNMYNFKTKVLKTINHEPLTITMIDDIQDTFHSFFTAYLRAHSPASRSWSESKSLAMLEDSGMAFADARAGEIIDSAVRGTLSNNVINPFRSIRILQYFGHASQMNTFWFVNPRILDMSYDSADHEGGDQGNHATIRFDYDALVMGNVEQVKGKSPYAAPGTDMYSPEIPVANIGFPAPHYWGNSYGGVNGGGGFLGNILSGVVGSAVSQVTGGMLTGFGNPIMNQVGRNVAYGMTRQITNTTRNTLFGSLGGVEREISNTLGNIGSGISNTVSDAGSWIKDSVSNMGRTSPPNSGNIYSSAIPEADLYKPKMIQED